MPIDPKLIATVASILVWLVGKFGLHADTVDVAPVVGALWVYVAAHAHAAAGGGDPPSSSGTTPTGVTLAGAITKVGIVALVMVGLSLAPLAACGASQATVVHDVICGVDDTDAIAKTLDDPTLNGYAKLLALGQEQALAKACIDAATQPNRVAPHASTIPTPPRKTTTP